MSSQNPIKKLNQMGVQAQRLIQIFVVAELVLFIGLLQRIWVGDWLRSAVIACTAVFLLYVYFLAKKDQVIRGGNILSCILTCALLYLMWFGEGLRDEVLLAFPAIFTFAILSGSFVVYSLLLLVVVGSIVAMSHVHMSQVWVFSVSGSTYTSAAITILLVCMTSFAIWLVSNDLRSALSSLAKENQRVRKSQKEIEKLVHYDSLTGLPNRTLAKVRFEYAIEQVKRDKKLLCVMFVDLDDFKSINDTLGHQAGDEYLVALAARLEDLMRKSDTVCRLGGDEFLILLPGVKKRSEAQVIARKVLRQVSAVVNINNTDVCCTCSIGLTFAPDDGMTFDTLCQNADMAMYQSKEKGKNEYRFFTDELHASQTDSMTLINNLRQAIQQQEFEVYYQPQIDIVSGKLVAAEALLRWHHPQRGDVSPMVFIPLAEQSGQIIEIGNWVLGQACGQLAKWREHGLRDMKMAVNVSPLQFKRGDFLQQIAKVLTTHSIPEGSLELEFTESLLMDNANTVIEQLNSIKQHGVGLAIDDFGTGYSSLRYLQNFDIEVLKIDRSFISNMAGDAKNMAIVKAIVHMANSLGIATVAEGIEDVVTLEVLAQLGCSIGQGYYWDKPLSAEQFTQKYFS